MAFCVGSTFLLQVSSDLEQMLDVSQNGRAIAL